MAMTDEQIERYSRHIILKEVGAKGQKKLLKGKVLIIGAGGLGAPAAMYLAAAGVGTIGIVDADEVDLSNLQRQIIHSTADIGKAKVKSAKETMNAMNPDVEVKTYRMFVDSSNIRELIREYDFIIDGTDNFPAKFLINDACVLEKKPFSHAGIIRFKGQLMTYVPGQGPCYRCVFKNPPPKDAVPTCKQAGVIGAMGGVIGSLQAMEAIKYLTGVGDLLTGSLLTFDALTMEFHKIKLPKDTHKCPVCGDNPTILEPIDYEQEVCEETVMAIIRMRDHLYDEIVNYAKEHLPEEACGLLAGVETEEGRVIQKVYFLENKDHAEDHFMLDPRDQMNAIKDMRANGLKPLGNWHSHPSSPSRPSVEDIRLAFDSKASYLILSLMAEYPVLNSFHVESGVWEKEDLRIYSEEYFF